MDLSSLSYLSSSNISIYVTILVLYCHNLSAQFQCGTTYDAQTYQMMSMPCIDMDIDEVPVKTIRVSFHVFQKDDGTGNIPNNSIGHNYLDAVEYSMNHGMENLSMVDYTTSSPYFQDSKIRYEVVDTHFWQNTEMWSKGDANTTANGNALYNFVMSQPISYKNTSVHLLMPGNHSGELTDYGGVACSPLGCMEWSMAIGSYEMFLDGYPSNPNHWIPGDLWIHELGHNFNLKHVFTSDNCNDTPNFSCTDCNNNFMDWGATKSSFTQCQLSRMHKWLEENPGVVKSGLPNYSISGVIDWNGGDANLYSSNYVPDPVIEVKIEAPGTSYFSWTKTSGSGYWWANGSGNLAHIEIYYPYSIHYDVSYEANCNEIEESFSFYYTGSFYRIYPNPIINQLNIEIAPENIQTPDQDKKNVEFWHQIHVYDENKNLKTKKLFESNFTKYSLDVSNYKPGIYYVHIQNPNFKKSFVVTKL